MTVLADLPTFPVGTMVADMDLSAGQWNLRVRNLAATWTQIGLYKGSGGMETIVHRANVSAVLTAICNHFGLTVPQQTAIQNAWATEDAKDP